MRSARHGDCVGAAPERTERWLSAGCGALVSPSIARPGKGRASGPERGVELLLRPAQDLRSASESVTRRWSAVDTDLEECE